MKHQVISLLGTLFEGGAFDVVEAERPEFGHYSTNLALRLGKELGKNPLDLAREFAAKIAQEAPAGFFEKVEAAPPGFINFWISRAVFEKEFLKAHKERKVYGKSSLGKGKTIIVEYSQPNIAKRMHVGHLRTTILGDALANIHAYVGYKVVRWNYYGDWGTQFGNLIAAYKMWGDKAKVKEQPIAALLSLYVRFHDEMKSRPELEARGREEFQKLESGDRENRKLWEWFKKESLKEFHALYRALGVRFDVEIGESFFERDLPPLIAELQTKGIARESEGSLIVPLEEAGLPPALIRKSDGASLYLTRDIANLRYRLKKYKPAKILYVVGNEQTLHFAQLFAIADLLGLGGSTELTHVKYGLVRAESGKKFATREGRAVFLEDVLQKAEKLARGIVEEKHAALPAKEKDRVARAVAMGALKYANLKEHRHSDIVFDWDRMLDFAGDSAPYLMYTYARMAGILRKAGKGSVRAAAEFQSEHEFSLVRKLLAFPDVLKESAEKLLVNNLTLYLYELAVAANRFYEELPVIKEEDASKRHARIALVEMVQSVLKQGLEILGIPTLERI